MAIPVSLRPRPTQDALHAIEWRAAGTKLRQARWCGGALRRALAAKMRRPGASVSDLLGDNGNDPAAELVQDARVLGDAVFHAVGAFAIAILAQVLSCASAGAVRQALGTGLRTHV